MVFTKKWVCKTIKIFVQYLPTNHINGFFFKLNVFSQVIQNYLYNINIDQTKYD